MLPIWQKELKYFKGIGPKLEQIFYKFGLHHLMHLLFFIPKSYDDFSTQIDTSNLEQFLGKKIRASVKVVSFQKRFSRFKKSSWFEANCVLMPEESSSIQFVWFGKQLKYIEDQIKVGSVLYFNGVLKKKSHLYQVVHPSLSKKAFEVTQTGANEIQPIYSEIGGIKNNTLVKIFSQLFLADDYMLPSAVPIAVEQKFNLPDLSQSLNEIHFPSNWSGVLGDRAKTKYFKRIIFEELFVYSLHLIENINRQKTEQEKVKDKYVLKRDAIAFLRTKIKKLPFELTGDQRKIVQQLVEDINDASKGALNTMIQGDVGCGKTIVAFLSAIAFMQENRQSCFMAPTEILAEQHFNNFIQLFPNLAEKVVLLTGSVKAKRKKEIKKAIKDKELFLVIGTHAVLTEDTEFSALALVIIDEQHRFGVKQRLKLRAKNKEYNLHFIVMTATPIPRSLALTIYGDLNLLEIQEKPANRKEIMTKIVYQKAQELFWLEFYEKVNNGEQAYVVYPLIKESEELDLEDLEQGYKKLMRQFPNINIAKIHGKMKAKDKEKIMLEFKAQKHQVLLSTTVIEVGVDVPNASVMVIQNSERFGLSQLHQLRGRVGRGQRQSFCYLLPGLKQSAIAKERLAMMVQTNNGFELAEKDLELRGPGEFMGYQQSGMPGFRVANLFRDSKVLAYAKSEAGKIIVEDPHFKLKEHRNIKTVLNLWFRDQEDLTKSG